ncbi:pyridoxal-phosphate dependent enzyme [Streptomyces sp. NPDC002476]|uniref:pyridoxal-phosphate dependent enzyme n=1 Tax=Streptomyces sp. NPDC002476 TaxID=3364648 RepID=UPI0036A863E6
MTPVRPVLARAIHRTPLLPLDVAHRGRVRRPGLKLEEHGPTGSVKDRSAVALLRALHDERPLAPGTVVVESTSGNLAGIGAHLRQSRPDVAVVAVDVTGSTAVSGGTGRRLIPDGGEKYRDPLLRRLGGRGIVKEVATAMQRLRREGLFFDRKHQEH